MKKIFVKLSMLLFVLVMSTTAWGAGSLSQLIPNLNVPNEMKNQLMNQTYCARLTGKTSSTGGGKVYVNAPALGQSATADPRIQCVDNCESENPEERVYEPAPYDEGTSNVATNGMGISLSEMSKIGINAWAKSDDGYSFSGFSYANMGTDLGLSSEGAQFGLYAELYTIGAQAGETIDYVIYGTFEPIRITGYTISDGNTTSEETCTQTVSFTFSGNSEEISIDDFESLAITSSKGGGSWTNTSGSELSISDLTVNSEAKTGTVSVKFTAPNENVAEYSANLQLKTKAVENIAINVPLNARTVKEGAEALLYDGKTAKETSTTTLSGLLNVNISEYANPIIKLNGDYANAVTLSKNVTFDLNGYDLNSTLTINNNANVTLAYSPYGGSITNAVSVESGSTLVLNGGSISGAVTNNGTLQQNGATISGAITNYGTMTTTDGVHTGALNNYQNASLTINGGSFQTSGSPISNNGMAWINKGTITSTSTGSYAIVTQAKGETTIEKLAAIHGAGYDLYCDEGGKVTVKCGKFTDPNNFKTGSGTITFTSAYFRTNYSDMASVEGKQVWRNTSGAENREGYVYFAGDLTAAQASGVSVCHIGGTSYSSLEEALAYANNTSEKVTIIMDNDYTLPAGYYTLPTNAVLIVPNSNNQGSETPIVERDGSLSLSEFRVLTFANGVNMDVHGTIEVSAKQYSALSGKTGSVTGQYGRIQMNKGSRMVLQSTAVLRAWGFITGEIDNQNAQHNVPMGEIDVRRGATVYEQFQMGDWMNTMYNAMGLISGDSRFPINSYFIQNVEVPTKYHPGSHLVAVTSVSAAGITMCANDVNIIGVDGEGPSMFKMNAAADAENTWVRKWYDASKDQQVYEINSGAHIGSLLIRLASSPVLPYVGPLLAEVTQKEEAASMVLPEDLIMNSGQYVLPITYNFKLHLLSGTMDFTQNTALLPGSELEIDKEATVLITDQGLDNVLEGSLYIYDRDDWPNTPGLVNYSPVFNCSPTTRAALDDAKVNVRGTFDTDQGYVFTSENGGNIFSSIEDAGTFMFTSAAKPADYHEDVQVTTSSQKRFYSAYLRNSDEYVTANGEDEGQYRYAKTGGTEAGKSYCYMDFDGKGGQWKSLTIDGCFIKDDTDPEHPIYYIKPQEYVALANGKTANADHTYSDAAGAGRLFILMTDEFGLDCQWWEVEAKDNYFHCIHPENDTYYEWDEHLYPIADSDDPTSIIGYIPGWKEKHFTITWKDWDGSILETYSVPYGTQAEWLTTNPTREKTIDYTYDFTGWSPALGKVTSDVTYTATYEAKQIKYTIVFAQDGGMEIERHLLARNEMPVCENVPTRTGYILEWSPALAAVTGNQTYTATWLPEPPTTYAVTFADYDGTVLKKNDASDENAVFDVDINGTISNENLALVPTPTKKQIDQQALNNKEYNYVFDHWQPAVTDPVTQPTIYTAVYREETKTYTVIFQNEGGSQLESHQYAWGETPVCSVTPTKANTAQYTYSFAWTPQIQTVQGAATYRATFTETKNKYTVTLQCNIPGGCIFSGAGIYDYGENVSISATPADGYTFVKWSERSGGANLGSLTVNGDITLTAVVKETAITPKNLNVGTNEVNVSSPANVMDLTITSDGISASGQLTGAENITLYGNADFVLNQSIEAAKWYCVAVPWRVNVNGGILLNGTTPAVLGKNIDICYYDGSVRAAQGKVDACWVYLKNLGASQRVLQPGRAYMIALKDGASFITFRKKAQEPLLTTSVDVQQYPSSTIDGDKDANWNAIANPALYHAFINAGSADAKAQQYNAATGEYDWFYLNAGKLVVGEPIYVQAPTSNSITANTASYAPARRVQAEARSTEFEVSITPAGASKYADHISVSLNEDKEENKYVIGQDLVKFGVSTKVAQMWIDRYDAKLCVNTVAPEGDATNFPMSIFAPKAGTYTIAIEREVATDDYVLYLTYNGEAIWNLSDGAYVLNLNKGTNINYGLRVSARAPQVTTGVDEAIVEAQGETAMKVLINNQVFIIRGNRVYSVDGQLVK